MPSRSAPHGYLSIVSQCCTACHQLCCSLPSLLVDWQAPWSAREAHESYAAPKVISGHGLMFEGAVQAGNKQAEEDARRVGQYSPSEKVESAQQLAGRLLTTVYMGTVNSSRETKDRAASLARQVLSLGTKNLDTESGLNIHALGNSSHCACADHLHRQFPVTVSDSDRGICNYDLTSGLSCHSAVHVADWGGSLGRQDRSSSQCHGRSSLRHHRAHSPVPGEPLTLRPVRQQCSKIDT